MFLNMDVFTLLPDSFCVGGFILKRNMSTKHWDDTNKTLPLILLYVEHNVCFVYMSGMKSNVGGSWRESYYNISKMFLLDNTEARIYISGKAIATFEILLRPI